MTHALLTAQAIVKLREPAVIFRTLCDHFEEHAEVERNDNVARMSMPYGVARMEAGADTLTLHAEGSDETYFSYIKWSLAEHLIEFAGSETPDIVWAGAHSEVGRPLPYFREMTVVSATQLTPMMRRVRLKGADLERFETGGLHVRLLFPKKGSAPRWPVSGSDGRPQWPEAQERPVSRIYTVRAVDVDAGVVDIDMVLHDGSAPGSDFARHAAPGDVVGLIGPSGDGIPEADWLFMAGDETAIPGIARILERLPASTTAVVRIEVADGAEEQALTTAADLDLKWLHRDGRPAGNSTLLSQALAQTEFPTDGRSVYAWSACEYADFKRIKPMMKKDKGLKKGSLLPMLFWRLGRNGEEPAEDH